jgi:hypothetical protein
MGFAGCSHKMSPFVLGRPRFQAPGLIRNRLACQRIGACYWQKDRSSVANVQRRVWYGLRRVESLHSLVEAVDSLLEAEWLRLRSKTVSGDGALGEHLWTSLCVNHLPKRAGM